MTKLSSDTAILLFTRSLESECAHKKLAGHQNEKIVQQLISHTETLVKKTCLPYFVSSDEYQFGDSFGERLFNEITRIFNAGYEKIIVIGNDSPGLSSKMLNKVKEEINSKNIVLGPSSDGGVYLIGIHRENLDRHSFINIPWLSDRVFKGFVDFAEKFSLQILNQEKLSDIDNEKDLLDYLSTNPIHKLSLLITSILASDTQYLTDNEDAVESFDIIGFKQLRAPPTIAN